MNGFVLLTGSDCQHNLISINDLEECIKDIFFIRNERPDTSNNDQKMHMNVHDVLQTSNLITFNI